MSEFKLKTANERYLSGNNQLVEYNLTCPRELEGRKIEYVQLFGFPETVADFFRIEEGGEKLQPVDTIDEATLKVLQELPDHVKAVIGIE